MIFRVNVPKKVITSKVVLLSVTVALLVEFAKGSDFHRIVALATSETGGLMRSFGIERETACDPASQHFTRCHKR